MIELSSLSARTKAFARALVSAMALSSLGIGSASAINVTTYHYDNFRTGWNPNETVLTPASVAGGNFGILANVVATGDIGVQPLIVQGVSIAGGMHDVVYLATNADNVEAFDATTGAKLLSVNLGTPPPKTIFPSPVQVGVPSTPVIDTTQNAMFLLTCTYENNLPVYRLHKLNLSTLTDIVPSVVVAGSTKLVSGQVVQFQATVQRQRTALLEANGKIYAGFGSFSDLAQTISRGWLLGWSATTLAPMTNNEVTNTRAGKSGTCNRYQTGTCYLTSIWMSQTGIAADTAGNLFFVTGNSQPGTYAPPSVIQESAVKMEGDLAEVKDIFTPHEANTLDDTDWDFGAGGITLLPPQPGKYASLAVAAGKSGIMYLLNRNDMGGHTLTAPDNVVGEYTIGGCWCGQTYFTGSDGIGRVVSSGDVTEEVWKLQTTPTVGLVQESQSVALDSGQDRGFFTVVSSNGTEAQTGIIWALSRPTTTMGNITLYAFNAADSTTIWSSVAGTWPNVEENANVVPVVANGKVYVWGGDDLAILGLGAAPAVPLRRSTPTPRVSGHEIYGTAVAINGNMISLKTRTGKIVMVDNSAAQAAERTIELFVGRALVIDGDYDGAGVMHAKLTTRAKSSPLLWYSDK
jgi:hypothetical protein